MNNDDITFTFEDMLDVEQMIDSLDTITVSSPYTVPDPVDITFNSDNITTGGYFGEKDVEQRLTAIEQRLAILVPDLAKLEKWEALREAYEHYKSLEALIGNSEPEDDC